MKSILERIQLDVTSDELLLLKDAARRQRKSLHHYCVDILLTESHKLVFWKAQMEKRKEYSLRRFREIEQKAQKEQREYLLGSDVK